LSKTLGIICEYNPFHNGHLYQLQESKKLLNYDYSVAIMSGNFTQRGEPAICDKWSRVQMALDAGVDLVIELPTIYSISSSENFAYGAVGILDSLNIIDYLSFGSEIGSIEPLKEIANILHNEPKDYKEELLNNLKEGCSFATSRQIALEKVCKNADILKSPNNILGIEYIKALYKLNSNIIPFTLKRKAVEHSSLETHEEFASASFIRNKIKENNFEEIKKYLPQKSFNILSNLKENDQLISSSLFTYEKEILYTLRNMTIDEIANIPDVSEGLEYLIKEASNKTNKLEELINIIKSKRYTYTRIQRILLYCLLGISKQDIYHSKDINNSYIRILGMNKNGEEILKEIIKYAKLPVITSVSRFLSNGLNNKLFLKDIQATNIYTLGYNSNSLGNLDFTKRIIKQE